MSRTPHASPWMSWAVATAMTAALATAQTGQAPDLTRYKAFEFGADPATIAAKCGMDLPGEPGETKKALQDLDCRMQPGSAAGGASVNRILFRFHDGRLFRMEITYDREKTEGLSQQDLIQALSAAFGPATQPDAEIALHSIYKETVQVIARWETPAHAFHLVQSAYVPAYAVVAFDKKAQERAAIARTEALRAEAEAAPARAAEVQRKRDAAIRERRENARQANKKIFEP